VVNPVIVALDMPTLEEAQGLAGSLVEVVGGFKVGMELLMAAGPVAIESIAAMGLPVFADAKLHDIPNTVRRAASRIKAAGARWVTVHAAGGRQMMEAALAGMGGEGVLGVTMLTSLRQADLESIGVPALASDYVVGLSSLAAEAGAEGVICSPEEIRWVKAKEPSLQVFTPGVRPETAAVDDQKRVASPERARADGADYLVIGRPITRARSPVEAARQITAAIGPFES
jgi:orotidine-5'-phosphate decarboxylase